MRIRESPDGDYTVSHVPLMHWFVMVLLVCCGGAVYIQGGPWWVQLILGLLILMMLMRNRSFTITTTFSLNDLKIRTRHRGLFGLKRRELDFSAVQKVDFVIERWGKHRTTPRANLTLWTLDGEMESDLFEVFVMANPDEGQRAAERISEILTPYLAPEIPLTAPVPAWFAIDTPTRLSALCRVHSSKSCVFEDLADLAPPRRAVMASALCLPEDEQVVAFHDLTQDRSAKRGIAIGCGGLYWKNGFFTESKSLWISWERFVDAEVSVDPNDADVWIAPSMQIGLKEKSQQKRFMICCWSFRGNSSGYAINTPT